MAKMALFSVIKWPCFQLTKTHAVMASSSTPALVLFLIDTGYHMGRTVGPMPAAEVIHRALLVGVRQMVFRSTKGSAVSPRYHIGCYAYGAKVRDIFGGIRSIDEVAQIGVPVLSPLDEPGDCYEGFLHIERILKRNIRRYENCPAPTVYHIAGGEYPGRNPEIVVSRIARMRVRDGSVLLGNVLIDDEAVLLRAANPRLWPGIRDENDLAKSYARQLYRMSSILPESMRQMALEYGYYLAQGSRMLYPGTQPDMISLGFIMAAATMIR